MAEKSKSVRLTAATMFPMMELFEDSRMTQKQFCIEMDLVPHTFTYWLNKYRKSLAKDKKHVEPKFVELDVASEQKPIHSDRLMRIIYPDGALVELPIR